MFQVLGRSLIHLCEFGVLSRLLGIIGISLRLCFAHPLFCDCDGVHASLYRLWCCIFAFASPNPEESHCSSTKALDKKMLTRCEMCCGTSGHQFVNDFAGTLYFASNRLTQVSLLSKVVSVARQQLYGSVSIILLNLHRSRCRSSDVWQSLYLSIFLTIRVAVLCMRPDTVHNAQCTVL
jgi:hypothetical protein